MPPAEKSIDFLVADRLENLNISPSSEWDVPVFLYRHGTIFTRAPQSALFLRHGGATVIAVLDRLVSRGFILHSRGSQWIRQYRFSILADEGVMLASFSRHCRGREA